MKLFERAQPPKQDVKKAGSPKEVVKPAVKIDDKEWMGGRLRYDTMAVFGDNGEGVLLPAENAEFIVAGDGRFGVQAGDRTFVFPVDNLDLEYRRKVEPGMVTDMIVAGGNEITSEGVERPVRVASIREESRDYVGSKYGKAQVLSAMCGIDFRLQQPKEDKEDRSDFYKWLKMMTDVLVKLKALDGSGKPVLSRR